MAQQMVNGSFYRGSVTHTFRESDPYAVVGEPYNGKHKKPQDRESLARRKTNWAIREECHLGNFELARDIAKSRLLGKYISYALERIKNAERLLLEREKEKGRDARR